MRQLARDFWKQGLRVRDNLDLVNDCSGNSLMLRGVDQILKRIRKQGSLALLRSEVHHRGVDDWDTDAAGQNWWVASANPGFPR